MESKKHFIIGMGDVGEALFNVLNIKYSVIGYDIAREKYSDRDVLNNEQDILHLCYPYSDQFADDAIEYISIVDPIITIVHSTVAVGTVSEINKGISFLNKKKRHTTLHSPIRGRHNELVKSLFCFVKYIGYDEDIGPARIAEEIFHQLGIKTELIPNTKITELGKLLSTTQFARQIILTKKLKNICNIFQLPYDYVVKEFNETYNEGYDKLRDGEIDVHRPILEPDIDDGFGGHCIVENAQILQKQMTKNNLLDEIIKIGQKET